MTSPTIFAYGGTQVSSNLVPVSNHECQIDLVAAFALDKEDILNHAIPQFGFDHALQFR